jgi:uncharacterized membrane protein YhaH (DUF805 family)
MTDIPPPPPGGPGGYGSAGVPALPNPLISYWKKVVLENYLNFDGRARRAEFWWYFLANLIISIVLNIIDAALGLGGGYGGVLSGIYGLAVLLPGIAVSIRRLHDTSRSGWWILIAFIPIVGIIVLIVFWATDSTPGANDSGMSEKYPT